LHQSLIRVFFLILGLLPCKLREPRFPYDPSFYNWMVGYNYGKNEVMYS
jgi:hypothetical protein